MFNEARNNGKIEKDFIKDIENVIKYIESKNIIDLKELIRINDKATVKPIEVRPIKKSI